MIQSFLFPNPYRRFHLRWWSHWFLWRTWHNALVFRWQRAFRGYATCDVWSVHSYLSVVVPGLLGELRRMSHGCPMSLVLFDNPELRARLKREGRDPATYDPHAEWDHILAEIAAGFGAMADEAEPDYTADAACWKSFDNNRRKRLHRALRLLEQYYLDLWD